MADTRTNAEIQAERDAADAELKRRGVQAADLLDALMQQHEVDALMQALEQAAADAPTARLGYHLRKTLPQLRACFRIVTDAAKEARNG